MKETIHRVDFHVGFELIASVIGNYDYINSLSAKWFNLRHKRGKEMGCSTQYRIDNEHGYSTKRVQA